jgi:hypothetical protein
MKAATLIVVAVLAAVVVATPLDGSCTATLCFWFSPIAPLQLSSVALSRWLLC